MDDQSLTIFFEIDLRLNSTAPIVNLTRQGWRCSGAASYHQ
jgi:hypothetical protein